MDFFENIAAEGIDNHGEEIDGEGEEDCCRGELPQRECAPKGDDRRAHDATPYCRRFVDEVDGK